MAAILKLMSVLLLLELAVLHAGQASPAQVVISEAQLIEMIQYTISESLNELEASLYNITYRISALQSQASQSSPMTGGSGSTNAGGNSTSGSCSAGSNDGSTPCRAACSCAEILSNNPNAPSGNYWIKTSDGQTRYFFCDMNRTCGGVTGGWTRVGYLDTANSTQACPNGLMERTLEGKRTCVAASSGAICSSVIYQSPPFSRVCGRVNGYFFYAPDGFANYGRGNNVQLDGNYVDGVSITHSEPREHIWTYAASGSECDCGTPPTAVGDNFFCDWRPYYTNDLVTPLWSEDTCGNTNSTVPWFFQELRQPTTDPIEMRVCRDQAQSNEDILLETIEIYVL